jgi:hypothetical protein
LELCVAAELKVDAVLKNQAIVFDEADVALLDYQVMAEAKKGKALVIGFTATRVRNIIVVEGTYLKNFSFNLFDSPFCREIPTDCEENTIEDFLKQEAMTIRAPVWIINCDKFNVDKI